MTIRFSRKSEPYVGCNNRTDFPNALLAGCSRWIGQNIRHERTFLVQSIYEPGPEALNMDRKNSSRCGLSNGPASAQPRRSQPGSFGGH